MRGVWYCKNRYVYDWSELKLYVCDLCTTLDATGEIKCGETGNFVFCVIKKKKLNDEKFSSRQEERFDVFDIFLPFSAGTDAVACYKVDYQKKLEG